MRRYLPAMAAPPPPVYPITRCGTTVYFDADLYILMCIYTEYYAMMRMEESMMQATWQDTGRLTRSADGLLAGVCAGLGQRLGVSTNLLRVIWLASVLFFGTGILAYLALWWVVPREDELPVEPVQWLRQPDGRPQAPLRRTGVDRKVLG